MAGLWAVGAYVVLRYVGGGRWAMGGRRRVMGRVVGGGHGVRCVVLGVGRGVGFQRRAAPVDPAQMLDISLIERRDRRKLHTLGDRGLPVRRFTLDADADGWARDRPVGLLRVGAGGKDVHFLSWCCRARMGDGNFCAWACVEHHLIGF